MKKKPIIVFAVIAVVLLLIPVKKVYEDGGTQTYAALTYKVIVWKMALNDGWATILKTIFLESLCRF